MNFKKSSIIVICCLVTWFNSISTLADGMPYINSQAVQAEIISDNSVMNDISAKSAILVEISTGTVIAEKNST